MIAALFVDANGFYANRDDVDAWPKERDARLYAGPLPVVAHPPCQLHTNLAQLNYKRYGGEHNRPGNDGGCFAFAVKCLLDYGGVLEHPAGSHAWKAHGLPRPGPDGGWLYRHGWWTCTVAQSAYGHRARKLTWLLYRGCARPPELLWFQPEGTHQVGWFDRKKPTLGKRESSATPPEFGEMLIAMAKTSKVNDPMGLAMIDLLSKS